MGAEMALTSAAALWARTGLIYFLATMTFGMYLGMTQQFHASSPHAHLGLLGWLSSLGFAFLHSIADPDGRLGWKAQLHWVMHNVGLVVQVTGLWLVIGLGEHDSSLLIVLGGSTVILSTLFFVVMIWPRLKARRAEPVDPA
jgi:hypothetical protein